MAQNHQASTKPGVHGSLHENPRSVPSLHMWRSPELSACHSKGPRVSYPENDSELRGFTALSLVETPGSDPFGVVWEGRWVGWWGSPDHLGRPGTPPIRTPSPIANVHILRVYPSLPGFSG